MVKFAETISTDFGFEFAPSKPFPETMNLLCMMFVLLRGWNLTLSLNPTTAFSVGGGMVLPCASLIVRAS